MPMTTPTSENLSPREVQKHHQLWHSETTHESEEGQVSSSDTSPVSKEVLPGDTSGTVVGTSARDIIATGNNSNGSTSARTIPVDSCYRSGRPVDEEESSTESCNSSVASAADPSPPTARTIPIDSKYLSNRTPIAETSSSSTTTVTATVISPIPLETSSSSTTTIAATVISPTPLTGRTAPIDPKYISKQAPADDSSTQLASSLSTPGSNPAHPSTIVSAHLPGVPVPTMTSSVVVDTTQSSSEQQASVVISPTHSAIAGHMSPMNDQSSVGTVQVPTISSQVPTISSQVPTISSLQSLLSTAINTSIQMPTPAATITAPPLIKPLSLSQMQTLLLSSMSQMVGGAGFPSLYNHPQVMRYLLMLQNNQRGVVNTFQALNAQPSRSACLYSAEELKALVNNLIQHPYVRANPTDLNNLARQLSTPLVGSKEVEGANKVVGGASNDVGGASKDVGGARKEVGGASKEVGRVKKAMAGTNMALVSTATTSMARGPLSTSTAAILAQGTSVAINNAAQRTSVNSAMSSIPVLVVSSNSTVAAASDACPVITADSSLSENGFARAKTSSAAAEHSSLSVSDSALLDKLLCVPVMGKRKRKMRKLSPEAADDSDRLPTAKRMKTNSLQSKAERGQSGAQVTAEPKTQCNGLASLLLSTDNAVVADGLMLSQSKDATQTSIPTSNTGKKSGTNHCSSNGVHSHASMVNGTCEGNVVGDTLPGQSRSEKCGNEVEPGGEESEDPLGNVDKSALAVSPTITERMEVDLASSPTQQGTIMSANGDHTPQSCDIDGKHQKGVLKRVSQFDTPTSARQSARKHVQFASQNDVREVDCNNKGHKVTPIRGETCFMC